jgi:glycosyltransferase involved in cell wall biosynthesis
MAGLKMDLSIVLPVYNGASFVASSVASLAEFLSRQRFSWEIVLVDDGSTDGTASLVPGGSRVTVVRLPVNRAALRALAAQAYWPTPDLPPPAPPREASPGSGTIEEA